MKPGDISIRYMSCHDLTDPGFETKLKSFLEDLGYAWKGQGTDVNTCIRDVSYTRTGLVGKTKMQPIPGGGRERT